MISQDMITRISGHFTKK